MPMKNHELIATSLYSQYHAALTQLENLYTKNLISHPSKKNFLPYLLYLMT